MTDAKHLFDNWGKSSDQSVFLALVELLNQFENIECRLLSICDILGVGLVLQPKVLKDSQTSE